MFRLLKLAILGVLGYAVYEFVQGLLHDTPRASDRQQGMGAAAREAGAEARRAFEQSHAGEQQFSNRGTGRPEMTNDPNGTSVRHFVGRGVVRR